MAVYNINGNETDSFAEALEFLRSVQADAKAPAVAEQHAAALQKPSALDLERAARGISAPEISAASATATLAARAEVAAAEVANN